MQTLGPYTRGHNVTTAANASVHSRDILPTMRPSKTANAFQSSHAILSYRPRIDFDEIEFQHVCARRHHEGLLDLGSCTLDIVAATYLVFAACRNSAAGPPLKIIGIVEMTLCADPSVFFFRSGLI